MCESVQDGALSEEQVNRLSFCAWQARTPDEKREAFGALAKTGVIRHLPAKVIVFDAPVDLRRQLYDAATDEQRLEVRALVLECFLQGELVLEDLE